MATRRSTVEDVGMNRFKNPSVVSLGYFGLAAYLAKNEEVPEAIVACQHSLEIESQHMPAIELLGDLLSIQEQPQGVLTEYLTCVMKGTELEPIIPMLLELDKAPEIYYPSRFWIRFATINIYQLKAFGLNKFKMSVNNNYFNWTGDAIFEHYKNVAAQIDWTTPANQHLHQQLTPPPSVKYGEWTNQEKNTYYCDYVRLMWEFTLQQDSWHLTDTLNEPSLGSPYAVEHGGHFVSQDLCNSILEINAALEGSGSSLPETLEVAELGGGYGRIEYILMNLPCNVNVTMIDIPPGLFIAQWYLSTIFSERKIFCFRPFASYEEIKDEFESASIRFLLPHQIALLPSKFFNLFMNVSSLHEMKIEQVKLWFEHIDRVCSGYFYTKQWREQINSADNLILRREDYPVNPRWYEIYNRVAPIQTQFFEALYYVADQE